MDALNEPLVIAVADRITAEDYAVQALAEAIAVRAEPLRRLMPTPDMIERAREIVRGTLDVAGRPFVVLVSDCQADAARLAEAYDHGGEDGVGAALLAIQRLTGG